MRRGRGMISLAIFVVLLSGGCAHRAPGPPPAASPPPVAPGDLAYADGAAAMEETNYERALEMFAAAWKDSPGHPGVAKDFPAALAGLKNSGDEAYRQGRPEDAGRRWSAVLRFSIHPAAEKGRALPFSKADIRGSIDRASSSLMERGLVEYRKGNLEAAIAIWKSILAFDPSHVDAARSLQTASTQLENLKKIPPPK